jgi:hypothetical protein
MAEYAQRRVDIMGIPVKSRNEAEESSSESTTSLQSVPLKAELDVTEVKMAALRIVGGWKSTVGYVHISISFYVLTFSRNSFKYDPLLMSSMLFGFGSLSEGSPPKRRRLDKSGNDSDASPLQLINTEIIVEGPGKPNERLVLVSKGISDSSDKMDVDERGKRKLEQDQRIFDVYKETRAGLLDETKTNMEVEDADKTANKAKVRFAEEPAKVKSKWTRDLIQADVQYSTIKFDIESIGFGDISFPAATWRWRTKDKSARQRRPLHKKRKGKKKSQNSAPSAGVRDITDVIDTAKSTTEAEASKPSPAEVDPPNELPSAAAAVAVAAKEKSPSEEGEIIED